MNNSINLFQIRCCGLIDFKMLLTNNNRFANQHLFHKYLSVYYVHYIVDIRNTALKKNIPLGA